jgi:hypothetical protein
VRPIDPDVVIEVDRQVLAAVVGNLLQNAFKFTQPRPTVTLRVSASAERVLIEVLDECLVSPKGLSTSCSAPSSSAVPIEPAWGLVWRSADGVSKRTTAASRRATCLTGDVPSPWICHAFRFLRQPGAAGARFPG